MNLLLKLLVSSLAVALTTWLLPGVHVENFLTAIVVAAVLGLLNTFIKPLLIILTIPVTILTLGLFLIVINAFIILMTDDLVSGFTVNGFWYALLFSFILSFITSVLEGLAKQDDKQSR